MSRCGRGDLHLPGAAIFLSLHNVYLYTNIFCRLDGLMAGALLALLVRSADFVRPNCSEELGLSSLLLCRWPS